MGTFGHDYGPDESETDDEPESGVELYPPDHPSSVQQCDHTHCSHETPEDRQRICDDCIEVMRRGTPNECSYCGFSV
jgi:hypothetical protein